MTKRSSTSGRAQRMEEPKDRLTAGYLALCGPLMGQPAMPEDRPRNIAWAIGLVMQFNAPGDQEWVALHQCPLCRSTQGGSFPGAGRTTLPVRAPGVRGAADPQAAQGYHQLQASFPAAVHPEYAWLYCRAAQQHRVAGEQAVALFTRAFADRESARAFFASKGWDFDEVEFTFLERAAAFGTGPLPRSARAGLPAARRRAALADQRQARAGRTT